MGKNEKIKNLRTKYEERKMKAIGKECRK